MLRRVKRLRCASIFLAFLLLTSLAARGEDPGPRDRILGGHLFQLPTLQGSAFIETSFAIRLGAASYTADPGNVELLQGKSLKLIGLAPEVSFSARVID